MDFEYFRATKVDVRWAILLLIDPKTRLLGSKMSPKQICHPRSRNKGSISYSAYITVLRGTLWSSLPTKASFLPHFEPGEDITIKKQANRAISITCPNTLDIPMYRVCNAALLPTSCSGQTLGFAVPRRSTKIA